MVRMNMKEGKLTKEGCVDYVPKVRRQSYSKLKVLIEKKKQSRNSYRNSQYRKL